MVARMVTGHSQLTSNECQCDSGSRLVPAAWSPRARCASAAADPVSRGSPETTALGVFSFSPSVVRILLRSPVIRLCVAAVIVNAVPWAAAGEIPSAAQGSTYHLVTDQQYFTVLLFAAIAAGVPTINTILNWLGFGKHRTLEQPIEVREAARYALATHEHPQSITRPDYEKVAAACALERRQAAESAKSDRESVQHQIDHLAQTIRTELKEHNAHAEERANELHGRITAFVGPLDALRARVDDHIHDARAHAKGNHS